MSYISRDVLTAGQKRYLKVKRALDVCFALLLLLLLWPLMLLAALWVKLESPGPAIYSQRRPGYHQKIFSIYKFRSMRVETTRNGVPLSDEERVTRSGKILRKTSIDELPQLFNILKGEMSLIGPGPSSSTIWKPLPTSSSSASRCSRASPAGRPFTAGT